MTRFCACERVRPSLASGSTLQFLTMWLQFEPSAVQSRRCGRLFFMEPALGLPTRNSFFGDFQEQLGVYRVYYVFEAARQLFQPNRRLLHRGSLHVVRAGRRLRPSDWRRLDLSGVAAHDPAKRTGWLSCRSAAARYRPGDVGRRANCERTCRPRATGFPPSKSGRWRPTAPRLRSCWSRRSPG
jgi:hypothetical protein